MKTRKDKKEELKKVRRMKDGDVYRPMVSGKPRREWVLIDDTGMVRQRQGWRREILAEHVSRRAQATEKRTYRIVVYLDSYDFQSHARLAMLNDKKEWTHLAGRNPGNGYPDSLLSSAMDSRFDASRKQFTANTQKAEGHEFDVVIADLMDIAERLTESVW